MAPLERPSNKTVVKVVYAALLVFIVAVGPCLADETPSDTGPLGPPGKAVAARGTHLAAPDPAREDAPPGTALKYFAEVDNGVYKGAKPESDADYRFLQSLHVKYIVVLRVLPFTHHSEAKRAKKYGITLIQEEMNASPFSPSEHRIDEILAELRDARNHPVYFHCAFGRDRTSVIAALYQMYFKGMPLPEALQYLDAAGYKESWMRSGLTRYIRKHPTAPSGLLEMPAAR